MPQRWYQKASVQASLVGGVFVALAAIIAGVFGLFDLTRDHKLDEQMKVLEDRLARRALEFPQQQMDLDDKTKIGREVAELEKLFEKGLTASQAETLYRMGNYYFSNSEFNRAIELYRKAIGARPDWEKPYLVLGLAYEMIGDFEQARDVFRTADLLYPDPEMRASVLLNLAATYFYEKEFHKALDLIERANRLAPSAYAYHLAAEAWAELGNSQGELEALVRFVELTEGRFGDSAEIASAKKRISELKR